MKTDRIEPAIVAYLLCTCENWQDRANDSSLPVVHRIEPAIVAYLLCTSENWSVCCIALLTLCIHCFTSSPWPQQNCPCGIINFYFILFLFQLNLNSRLLTQADNYYYYYYYYWSLLYSTILRSRADSLRSHVILHEWIAFYSSFLNIHRSGVLKRWHGWCHKNLLPSRRVLCTP